MLQHFLPMLMEKVRKLAVEWGKTPNALNAVARESLLYGMRIETKPGRLKQELRKVGIDSKIATPLWSGDYYLLLGLPQVLIDPKAKIPCLEDYQFAKSVLRPDEIAALRERFKNVPQVSREEIFKKLLPVIKNKSYRGRFLPQFDQMHEKRGDVLHDLICEALAIMNKEWTEFRNPKRSEEIIQYLSFCVSSKTNTYLKAAAPKMKKARVEDAGELEALINQQRSDDLEINDSENTSQLKEDLKRLLPTPAYNAVALLLNFADPDLERGFEQSLVEHGLKRQKLPPMKLKNMIERHLKIKVFEDLKNSKELGKYLRE